MYLVMMLALIGGGLGLALWGAQQRRVSLLAAGVVLSTGSGAFFWFMGFWGEMLWFESLGYHERFLQVFFVQSSAGALAALFGAAVVYLLTAGYSGTKKHIRFIAVGIGAVIGLNWGVSNWEELLRFFYAAPTEMSEPIFNKKVGFYLFSLPLLQSLQGFLFMIVLVGLTAIGADAYVDFQEGAKVGLKYPADQRRIPLVYRGVAVFLLVLALSKFLERYYLMFSPLGATTGPGWTDVHIRLPALSIMIAFLLAAALVLLIPVLRNKLIALSRRIPGVDDDKHPTHIVIIASLAGLFVILQLLLLSVIPAGFQRLRVEPNEITFEKPYIANNIELTRHGFRLHEIEEREYPAEEKLTPEMVESNPAIFENIRLWDWRALDSVYKQFQEIRLYYEFDDVDIDRYTINGDYLQVMVSGRELAFGNLPRQSQTFVNQRFKYTHGYGITMTNVSEFTDEGLPDLLIKDIPPKSASRELAVKRPEIYYGELTDTAVLVNTSEKEFDYPKGEENAYVRYAGDGGVLLKNLWRKFLYGWKFDGMRLFLSGYPTEESRIMFHRQIKERAARLAPFLEFDNDPYIVLADGKLYWIIDSYTTSSFYPYSERFIAEDSDIDERLSLNRMKKEGIIRFRGKNYVRNSVKTVIDAYDGSVDFYIFDEQDPVIRTWAQIFPEMFKKSDEMDGNLRDHVRYPSDMLLLQGLVYAKYHMTDPTVFYNQEDLWVRATEKYYNSVQPVEPYYIIWEQPESDNPEFVLMLPFTPKNRQVSIGWIAGMCDGENYGRFLAYKFPKEKRVLGPQQVETKIDQDRFLSSQLTLWDQRGSRVIRGNVLAIPVEDTLLYVEPIYLQAETAAYPELRIVALMHNDTLSYGESFDEALQGLFGEDSGASVSSVPGTALPAESDLDGLIDSAGEAFSGYLEALGNKEFQGAAHQLQRLESALNQLSERRAGSEDSD